MRILIDTNVLISVALNADGVPYQAYVKAASYLRAAIKAKADILLTGDKDFLESGLKNPMIITPAEFLSME